MAVLLFGPGIAIFAMEGHPEQVIIVSHWLPLTVLKNQFLDINESTLLGIAIFATTGLFTWYFLQRKWWVICITGGYVSVQMVVLLLFFAIGPLQT